MKRQTRTGYWLCATLLAPLVLGAVSAAAATGNASPTSVVTSGPSFETVPAGRFELKGVLISASSRSALVNGRLMREGEQVAGATIVAIGEKSVRVRVRNQDYDILVGSRTLLPLKTAGATRTLVRQAAASHRTSSPPRNHVAGASEHQPPRPRHHRVAPGESLSLIASRYEYEGVSHDQLMMALFRANPDAFGGNINLLRAGSVLRMPRAAVLRTMPQATASAAVAAQMSVWRAGVETAGEETPAPSIYGPVRRGETLSAIAARLPMDGLDNIEQRMLALFDANPQAFNDNINLLRSGATLRIPQFADVAPRDAATAAAEVREHMVRWRDRGVPRPIPTPLQVAASRHSR